MCPQWAIRSVFVIGFKMCQKDFLWSFTILIRAENANIFISKIYTAYIRTDLKLKYTFDFQGLIIQHVTSYRVARVVFCFVHILIFEKKKSFQKIIIHTQWLQ